MTIPGVSTSVQALTIVENKDPQEDLESEVSSDVSFVERIIIGAEIDHSD